MMYTALSRLPTSMPTKYAVVQAAVWIVTDNPGDYTLLNTLVYSGGNSAINSDDLAIAKEIIREAG